MYKAAVRVVYYDPHILVVDKPGGLLSVPGRTAEKQDCLWSRLASSFDEVRMVHRLDRDTSGLMVWARTRLAQSRLARQFQTRCVQKQYVAMVDGIVVAQRGRICLPLRRDMTCSLPPRHMVDCTNGRPATTDWIVVARTGLATRLLLRPITGRSHQLRVHCQAIGHPIVGDPIYGVTAHESMLLHARRLTFYHPLSNNMLHFRSYESF